MIERDLDGMEIVERRICPLAELDEGKDAPLGRLVRYWFSMPRPNGIVPDIGNIGLMQLTELGVLGWFHVIDVKNENPENYAYQICALRTIGHQGLRLAEVPSNAYRHSLEKDYIRAKTNRFPLFQHVATTLRGHSRTYRRVTLPLTDQADDVSHLLVGVHFDN